MTTRRLDVRAWTLLVVSGALALAGSLSAAAAAEEGKASECKPVCSGKVQQVGDQMLTIAQEEGATNQIQTDSNTRITLNGKQVPLDQLKPGDQVRVRLRPEQARTAAMVRASRPAGAEDEQAQDQPGRSRVALGVVFIQTPEGEIGVWRVMPRGPAAKAGLERGDEILEIDGQEIASARELIALIGQKQPGDEVRITFARDGQEQTATIQLVSPEEVLSAAREARQERRAARQALEEDGEAARPESEAWLGVLLGETQDEGVRVARVFPHSPAANAGLRRGDVLRRLNDQKVDSSPAAQQALDRMKPGDKVQLHIVRDGQEQTLEATLGDRESRREAISRFREERMSRPDRDASREGRSDESTGRIEEMLHDLKQDLKKDIQGIRDEVRKLREESSQPQD